ncbi:hypothetical protein A2U01_0091496, partial [Trifolium medium]|nr:hypothetical protein [Trifolium medium]
YGRELLQLQQGEALDLADLALAHHPLK